MQHTGPNRDGSAEWNAYWDAPAAKHVIEHGIPVHVCALDCSQQAPLTSDLLARLARYPALQHTATILCITLQHTATH